MMRLYHQNITHGGQDSFLQKEVLSDRFPFFWVYFLRDGHVCKSLKSKEVQKSREKNPLFSFL